MKLRHKANGAVIEAGLARDPRLAHFDELVVWIPGVGPVDDVSRYEFIAGTDLEWGLFNELTEVGGAENEVIYA